MLEYGPNDRLTLGLYAVTAIGVHWRIDGDQPRISTVSLAVRSPGTMTKAARESLRQWAAVKFGVPVSLVSLTQARGGEPR